MFTPRRRREALTPSQALAYQIAALFAAGEQGAWYDPSDMSTMFQDTAGTIPVNAINQRVARINDKSGRGNHLTQATTGLQPFLQSENGLRYLDLDGIGNAMATASIDFTAGDSMTWAAGVRKLSDAALGVVIESSANAGTTNGSFGLYGPSAGGSNNYLARSRGTTAVTQAVGGASPVSSVLVCQADISTPLLSVQNNAGAPVTLATSQGTGNYTSQPMYLGARAGTGSFFTGRFYGAVVRGAASNAAQVASIRDWLNSKTGAF